MGYSSPESFVADCGTVFFAACLKCGKADADLRQHDAGGDGEKRGDETDQDLNKKGAAMNCAW